MIKFYKHKVLDIEKLSMIDLSSKKTKQILKNINMSIYENEIVSIIGSCESGKTCLSKAIAGEMPFNAYNLSVNNINVIDFSDSVKNKNRPTINVSKNVNLISKEKVKEFNMQQSAFKHYLNIFKKQESNNLDLLKDRITLDISYLEKLLNISKINESISLKDEVKKLSNIKTRYYNLFSKTSHIRVNNASIKTHDEVQILEKKYIYALEKINEKINVLKSTYLETVDKYKEHEETMFNESFYSAELELKLLNLNKNKVLDKLKQEFEVMQSEMAKDFSDLHKSHLKERKDFIEKSFNDERNKYEREFLKQKNELLLKIKTIKEETAIEKRKKKKLLKVDLKNEFYSEILSLQDDYKVTLKEFLEQRNNIMRDLRQNKGIKIVPHYGYAKLLESELSQLRSNLKTVKIHLIAALSDAVKGDKDYIIWKAKADRIILNWKKMWQLIYKKPSKIHVKTAKVISIGLLEGIGISKKDMFVPINELSLFTKWKILIGESILLNKKLTIIDDVFCHLPLLEKAHFIKFIKKMKNTYQMGFLIMSRHLEFAVKFADRVFILENGKFVESGKSEEVIKNPIHPHTKALCNTMLGIDKIIAGHLWENYNDKDSKIEDENSISKLNQIGKKDHFVFANNKEIKEWTKVKEDNNERLQVK